MKLTRIRFGVAFGCHTSTTTNNNNTIISTASGNATCQQGLEGAELAKGLSLFAIWSFKWLSGLTILLKLAIYNLEIDESAYESNMFMSTGKTLLYAAVKRGTNKFLYKF